MSTPVKVTTSLLLKARNLSPLSPKVLTAVQPPRLQAKPIEPISLNEENRAGIQFKLTKPQENFILNTPNRRSLLSSGLSESDSIYMLGKGAFGTVFTAKYKNTLVAAKLIKAKTNINERNGLALSHKNITTILDIIAGDNYTLVIMEYCVNSKTLNVVLNDANFILDRKTILKFARDVIDGLKYCHSCGVLHLDIKPQNILLYNDDVCRICDFGNSYNFTVKNTNWDFRGTVAYTAPEILKGDGPTVKSDIYSFGILLWQLLSRKSPYKISDNHILIYKVVKFNLRPFTEDLAGSDLLNLCISCWEQNPTSRLNSDQLSAILGTLL